MVQTLYRPALLAQIALGMAQMKRQLAHTHATRMTKPNALTPAQIGIMSVLAHEGSSDLKRIASCLGTSSSAATQLINGLVDDGLISRKEDGKDRRKTDLKLTASGKHKLNAAKRAHIATLAKLLAPLSDKELQQWHHLQSKIIQPLP